MSQNPVLDFAVLMQVELDKNDHKGTWRGNTFCDKAYLLKRLKQEVKELERAIKKGVASYLVQEECADVANFAMMLSENYHTDYSEGDSR